MKLKKADLKLKRKLNYHYKYFDASQIHPDPLEFPHKFSNWHDIEISAFLSSVFAYGNVKQIIRTLEELHRIMDYAPYEFVRTFHEQTNSNELINIKHRFFSEKDIHALFMTLNRVYNTYGSLKYLFLLYHFPTEGNIKNSLSFFSNNLLNLTIHFSELTPGIKFMFPDPLKGSACKRMNLFLRWMVRKDELDFGLWEEIHPSQLVIPVDTHVAKICKELKLTRRKNVSWKMAEEITDNLKIFNAEDPVKYDFAICHIGMRKLKF